MAGFTSTKLLLGFCCLVTFLGTAESNAFRGQNSVKLEKMSVDRLRSAVMDELLGAVGNSSRVAEKRLSSIEEALKPTFLSMPKNENGKLDSSAVRYVLHRLFVQRHGMFIKGLEPGGSSWNSTSATEVLEDRVPAYLQSLFEERLHGQGMGMHEIAILAATLEHLIHDEAVDRLKVTYDALGLSLEDRLNATRSEEVIETYMMLFILGRKASDMSPEDVRSQKETIGLMYPGWPESQQFAQEVRHSVVGSKAADPAFANGELTFEATSQVVEEIGERYGRWQDTECRDLKSALVKLEDRGTGRVLLKDFYGQALTGAWQFTESVDYLRELGALEESGPNGMSVLISNYVNSHSNCLASSSIYSVCCINECEALLGHLEKEISSPEAEVSRITELVSSLPSSTVAAPRQLSTDLHSRLEEVASHHGGKVPLHGRLFAQWMHHAYPRECPYPHVTGSTNPMTADEWMQEKGAASLSLTKEEMQQHVETANPAATSASPASESLDASVASSNLPWTVEEELVVKRPERKGGFASSVRSFATFAAAAALLLAIGRSFSSGLTALSGPPTEKQFVLPYARKQHIC